MTTWTGIPPTSDSWTLLSSIGSWTGLAPEVANPVGLENGTDFLLMENATDALLWGDVWTQV